MTPLTLHDFIMPLAYCQRIPVCLKSGQRLPVAHLRALAARLQCPVTNTMHLRETPKLLLVLSTLIAGNLLRLKQSTLIPHCQRWLAIGQRQQLAMLQSAAESLPHIEPPPFNCKLDFVQHQWLLQQLSHNRMHGNYRPISLHPSQTAWQLHLPPTVAANTLFHLHQFADPQGDASSPHWLAPRHLELTNNSLADALSAGYDIPTICHWLEQAYQAPLPTALPHDLYAWQEENSSLTVEPVYLLTARDPNDLADLQSRRRIRRHITQQLTPRHAIVTAKLADQLTPDRVSATPQGTGSQSISTDFLHECYLALATLSRLKTVCHLPLNPSRAALNQLAAQVAPHTLTALAHHADAILDQLRRAIDGIDSFHPAIDDPDPAFHTQIEQAIHNAETLEIDYQSLAADSPATRRIDPLYCEQRGDLFYLRAYCHRADAERTFRLDRIHAIRQLTDTSHDDSSVCELSSACL